MKPACLFTLFLTVAVLAFCSFATADDFQFRPEDRIGIIGNTLAERMQHDGYLEATLHAAYSKHQLTIRNMGFSGDELTVRLRSSNFGSQDDWLTRTQADVVFAFFGYNESFAGEAGLPKFREDLKRFIEHTRNQKYNGQTPPRLVIFSPIAHENLRDPNLPDGSENNHRLALYTSAMQAVTAELNVPFVDLFNPTRQLYETSDEPLTINGVHLNERGNAAVARIIHQSLAPATALADDEARFEQIRRAVQEKNFYWFNRYRTTDGYSIYGGRADLKFTDGQTNREVMQREMEVLDVMTANRDRVIWGAAQGTSLTPDDSNLPPFIPVITNKPGDGPNGEHLFLSGEQAIELMTVADGFRVELFADEAMFPELVNPVQMAFDPQGRLFVGTWESYPHWKPGEIMDDRLLILEDTNGDGKADKVTTFADGLHNPTGFEFWGGGVIVGNAPDLLFLKDTTGDGKADVRERILHGIDSADTHHAANSFVLSPGGALFFQEGTFHHTAIESPHQAAVRSANAGVFRFEPLTRKIDCYVAFGFANPHGHVFDKWGQDIIHDGTGAVPYHGALFSGHTNFPQKHGRPPTVYQQRTRPCPATEYVSGNHFPPEMNGNLLVQNVIGFQGILQYRIEDDGASFKGTEADVLLSSTDPKFRPVDLEFGPDGALYFVDWHNPIVGHMQHNLRDPSRDRKHGRVYRLIHTERPLDPVIPIAKEPTENLVSLLSSAADRVRYRAKIELSARNSAEVLAAVENWAAELDPNHADFEHHLLEALWMHQYHNVVNVERLERMLRSSDFRARAAAVNVLCYWRDRVPNVLDRLLELASDPHPRVRLEAVRAASFLTEPEALEVALVVADQPTDRFLDFVIDETRKTLKPIWDSAIQSGQSLGIKTPSGQRFYVANISNAELLKQPRTAEVFTEMLTRAGLSEEDRRAAVSGLAELRNTGELDVLLAAVSRPDLAEQAAESVFDLVRLITQRPASELQQRRSELEQMARGAELPIVRQVGFVSIIAADASVEPAWKLAESSLSTLRDFVNAVPLIPDPSVRARLYDRIAALLDQLPTHLQPQSGVSRGTYGRFVRIELPGNRRTLTLAEVEIFSDGRNVARSGKATQSGTSHGGVASRAIDGNKDSSYGGGGQTHTPENSRNPWWEVDLQDEFPIDSISIYNRMEGDLGERLNGFTLQILDAGREVVAQWQNQPTPKPSSTIEVGGSGPHGIIRRAAIAVLPVFRGREGESFRKMAQLVIDGEERSAAMIGLQRIPSRDWPQDVAGPLVNSVLAFLETIPVAERTTPTALNALQLGDSLAAVLPMEEGQRIRKLLGDLGVRVIRIGTVPHQMAYDRERIVVQAGKPVEFIFENTDIMPHNLAITKPGRMEAIGQLAEATAQQPDAAQRHYIPQSPDVLLGSRLLQTRESQTLSWTAPREAGVYPYVCTYPGHWRRMYGALYVVEDLDAYLAEPEAYVQQQQLAPQDELLAFNRPRKEWTLDELASAVSELKQGGRSFGNGKQMFTVANCVACHRLNDEGYQIGQDLTQLDPEKNPPLEILRHILEPSLRIDDKFATYLFELESGKVLSGVILEENDDSLKLIENPLAKSEPLLIKKSEIAERVKSPTSMMPKGLLSKLTHTEILDLVAFIAAKGKPDSPYFKPTHGSHGGSHQH